MEIALKALLFAASVIVVSCGESNSGGSDSPTGEVQTIGGCEMTGRFGNDPVRYPDAQNLEVQAEMCMENFPKNECNGRNQVFRASGCPSEGRKAACNYQDHNFIFYSDSDMKIVEIICTESDGKFVSHS